MKKKIIFFDGDGTLWYPKKTKREEKPHWIYLDEELKDNYLEHLELTPGVKETLKYLLSKGIHLVVISANPRSEDLAVQEIKERLGHFKLDELFHLVRSSNGDDTKDKGRVILEVLENMNIEKSDALMVGDSYKYDYVAAKGVGVDAIWIENSVSNIGDASREDIKSIKELDELIKILL